MDFQLNSLGLVRRFLSEHVRAGGRCIDATAGRGRDTVFLCSLVGPSGRVIALDVQQEAVQSTKALLVQTGFEAVASVFHDGHEHMEKYAEPDSVDAIVFNFGWLPGGNHAVFTRPETSLPAVEAGLRLLRPGGIMSLCVYYGGENGVAERDALLDYVKTIPPDRFTVLVSQFANRTGNPAIPVFIWKNG